MALAEVHQRLHVGSRSAAFLHAAGQLHFVLTAAGAQGIDGRQGQFALQHVGPGGFAHVAVEIVEYIITNLETDAHYLPQPAGLFLLLGSSVGGNGSQMGAGGKQGGRLLADDAEISLLADLLALDVGQLEDFTLRKGLAQIGDNLHHLQLAGHGSLQKRLRKQIVAHQHGYLVVVLGID